MGGDEVIIGVTVVAIVILMALAVAMSRKSMRGYGAHIATVTNINNQILAMNRELVTAMRETNETLS